MKIKLMDNLTIESEIPILYVDSFWFCWKPYCHAVLNVQGYIDRKIEWNPNQSFNIRIRICLEEDEKATTIYYGYVMEVEIKNIGKTSQIFLKAMSASCLLDQRIESRSFQNTAKTYGEVVRENVQADGGQVIRNQETDKKIECPVIRCEETTWQFANRMARRLGNYIIPDVETGNPNLWFGMRNGKEVSTLPEAQCDIQMHVIGSDIGTRFKAEGRNFYKIGDRMEFLGQKVTIVEVEGRYWQGELTFKYILEEHTVHQPDFWDDCQPAGQGFWGVIQEVKEETIKIALDIDQGQETGDYFYPWYPETGNALYAMPEVGAKALLYFFEAGEREGAVIHCLNKKSEENLSYKDRFLNIEDGNVIDLSRETVCFSRGSEHTISLDDHTISTSTSKGIKIMAEGKIRLKARQITIKTPEELIFYQG